MRSHSLIVWLALAGTALSGCASGFDQAFLSSVAVDPTDTGGDGLSGDNSGGQGNNDVTLSGGDTTLSFVDGARDLSGAGVSTLSIDASGVANVAISPASDLGFGGAVALPTYLNQDETTTVGATAPSGALYSGFGFDNANYTEFRQITSTDDNVLQYWEFTNTAGNSYAAHYRNSATNQDAWFFGGTGATDDTTAPAITGGATVNYTGNYAGTAETANWGDAAAYQTTDGLWRMNGTAQMSANFGTGEFTGTLTPEYWEKFEDADIIQISIPGNTVQVNGQPSTPAVAGVDVRSFHTGTIELNGTINGNTVSGDAHINDATPGSLVNNRFVNGDRALEGGFYGNNAEQVTGVFSTFGVLPTPTGGDTGLNDDRRATVDIQGVFHGR